MSKLGEIAIARMDKFLAQYKNNEKEVILEDENEQIWVAETAYRLANSDQITFDVYNGLSLEQMQLFPHLGQQRLTQFHEQYLNPFISWLMHNEDDWRCTDVTPSSS